ncbi:MAG: hypothetical protein JOZ77_12615 [Candidatus Eremiobacteraeota bacterium]|nr:hypothetical protein [Candidatus Eremiobacteraeota bacterium]
MLVVLGMFSGALPALCVAPIACGIGALLFWRLPALKQRVLSVNLVQLCYGITSTKPA